MVEMDIVIQGRFTKFPGKEQVIRDLNNGIPVRLRVEKDYDDQIVLANCITDELTGCIPPNPSYIDKYMILRKIVDGGNARFITVHATESCSRNKHYRAKLIFWED